MKQKRFGDLGVASRGRGSNEGGKSARAQTAALRWELRALVVSSGITGARGKFGEPHVKRGVETRTRC
jgi:hypothetical protein